MLAAVINPSPGDDDFSAWAFNHYQDHLEIIQGVVKEGGPQLELLEIDQINFQDVQSWLERHQQMHNDMNAVLKLQGNDLTAVDFRDVGQRQSWMWLNFREHFNAREALAI
jgi:hypothetical protein